jgi:N-methylhydantoinase A
LQISRVMIPPSAGVFSAIGLLCADVEYHLTKTRLKLLRTADPAEIASIFGELESEARARLTADNFPPDKMQITRSASMHYQGQSDELEIEVPQGALTREALAGVEEAFNTEHERTYGHRASEDEPIEVVSLRVVGRGMPDVSRAAEVAKARLPENVTISNPIRRAYFGQSHGWLESRIINRSELAMPHQGPCIVEEYDSTCVIPPGCTASLDSFGNIVIAVSQHSKA